MIEPLGYWRGTVDGKLKDHGRSIRELRDDVDDLQKARWRFSGVLAAATILGSIAGGIITTVAAYLLLGVFHHP